MKTEELKEVTQLALAVAVVLGGLLLLYFKPEIKTESMALLMLVLGYYYGSSPGSLSRQAGALKDLISARQKGSPDDPEAVG